MIPTVDPAKTVFLFPGVGAQRPGMFAEFTAYPEYRACLEEVSDVSGLNLYEVIHGDAGEALKQVRVAQLALTATTVAVARILRTHCGLVPDFVMGHSLGQYPALCAAGYLDLATLTRIVNLRSEVVEACARDYEQGEMCWVLHVPAEVVAEEVEKARLGEGIAIHVSAVDAFDQATVSATMADIRRFAPRIEAIGGLLYPLRIGGPFHSPLMAKAQEQLAAQLDGLLAARGESAVLSRLVCNVSARELAVADLKSSVLQHLVSPVQWLRSLQYIVDCGVTRYLEISPKTVLSYLNQRAALPLRALCEPDELPAFAQALSSAEQRVERFVGRSYAHLYGTRLPELADAAANETLCGIRDEVKRCIRTAQPGREDCELLYQRTRQWLQVVEDAAGIASAAERARLDSLYAAARR